MKLITFRREDDTESIGVLREDVGAFDLLRAIEIYATASNQRFPIIIDMFDLINAGLMEAEALKYIEEYIEKHDLLEELKETNYRILAPIARPGAIYALGRNYPAHAREGGADVPTEPIIFGKAATAVVGPEDDVIYKKWLTRVDYEAELAVVIGKQGSDIPEDEAASYIAGYTCVNDVTARDLQSKDIGNAHPWFRSKGIDTFCPMGPCITLPDEITHPVELNVEMHVNGETTQKDNTRSMTFNIPFLISWISRFHTLYPGDVISTGTPAGIGPVVPGDVMEVYVEKIGILRNRVVAEE